MGRARRCGLLTCRLTANENIGWTNRSSPNVIRIFAKVPRAKIEAYRKAQNDHASSDTDIAYNLSELSVEIPPPSLPEFGLVIRTHSPQNCENANPPLKKTA